MNKPMRPKTYLLAKAIQERKDVLFGSVDAVFKPQGLKEKEEAWEAIRAEMIENGFTNFERKSWKDVRNHDWQYLRRSAASKFEHNQKARQEGHNQKSGSELIQYNEVDKVVFDIMGNEPSFNDHADSVVNLSSPAFDFFGGSIDLDMNIMNKSFSDADADTMGNLLAVAAASSSIPCTSTSNAASSSNSMIMNSTGLNIPLMDHQQQQLHSLFSSVVNRKTSWDTNSSTESSKEARRSMNESSDALNEYSKLLNNGGTANIDILNGLNMNGFGVFDKQASSSSANQNNVRKRRHSSTNRPIDEEIQEAKLQLLLLQVKREEVLLQQEKAKVLQEQAKARQEEIKAALLEREFDASKPA